MNFELAALPYAQDALAPIISSNALHFHYDLHHKGYMNKLKKALAGTADADKSLEEIIKTSSGDVFNSAAQIHNHTFFWNSMKPGGGGMPPAGPVLDLLVRDFGSWEEFRKQFIESGMTRFGSGWTWLVLKEGQAKILSTANAYTPLTTSAKPLLTVDLWEHSYYLDFQNRRDTYLALFCDRLINWDFVLSNLVASTAAG